MRKTPFIVLMSIASCPTLASAAECSKLDAYAAETIVDYLDSWKNVHLAYQQFSHCDDGGIAEGYSDRVVNLLATNWQNLPQLAFYVENEASFGKFIVAHINATANRDDLIAVVNFASSQCPGGFKSLCMELGQAATKAVAELAAMPHNP